MLRNFSESFEKLLRRFFSCDVPLIPGRLMPRWIFLRALGLIFFSAFYSLYFQVRGLIGPGGLLPVGDYLQSVAENTGAWRFWYAPGVFWLGNGDRALIAACWVGMAASLLLVANLWPRATTFVCLVLYVSFISVLQDFSSYQHDGMLIEASFLCLFFAPPGIWPGWGRSHPPSRASLFLLQWLCFRVYFESGLVKILSGDEQWRHLTAMFDYYQNGPLPSWIGWYAAHLPRWVHYGTAGLTLLLELVLVWMFFLPRRFRIILFCIITPWQIGIILTSNYAYLNYLMLALGLLLVDDEFLARWLPPFRKVVKPSALKTSAVETNASPANTSEHPSAADTAAAAAAPLDARASLVRRVYAGTQLRCSAVFLAWIAYATVTQLIWMVRPNFPLPPGPVAVLEPFRVANAFGFFAVMTRGRYEIEFQGSNDGKTWVAYPFRYKPQELNQAPGIYAPYQPRFEWNLWFASLGSWRQNPWVLNTEERLSKTAPPSSLFARNPFPAAPPQQVRSVVWQYWFTDWPEKRQGLWWRREFLGLYAPQLEMGSNGRIGVARIPQAGASPRE